MFRTWQARAEGLPSTRGIFRRWSLYQVHLRREQEGFVSSQASLKIHNSLLYTVIHTTLQPAIAHEHLQLRRLAEELLLHTRRVARDATQSSVYLLGVLADRGDILAAELHVERAEVVLQVLQIDQPCTERDRYDRQ